MAQQTGYELLDSGDGFKLERFGDYVLSRPAGQAIWHRQCDEQIWRKAHAQFIRKPGQGETFHSQLPERWTANIQDIRFHLSLTDFGHIGVFPEQQTMWQWLRDVIKRGQAKEQRTYQILNLFAYTGGSTLAAAQAGAEVCHLDASRGMVERARENADLNGLSQANIRWIIDDVNKFLRREERRNRRYDGIIADPPSFGRGLKGEVFKIQQQLLQLLELCRSILTENPAFLLLTCHTHEYSETVLRNVLQQQMSRYSGDIESGEMLLTGQPGVYPLPCGVYSRWVARHLQSTAPAMP